MKEDPMKINLKDYDKTYSVTTGRRIPFLILSKVKIELERLESDGVIEKVTQSIDRYASKVPVKKKWPCSGTDKYIDPASMNKVIDTD